MSKHIRRLIQKARDQGSNNANLVNQAHTLADELEAMLNRGWPYEHPAVRAAATELQRVLMAIRDEWRKQNIRTMFGIWVSELPEYREAVDRIETVKDPEMRAFFIEEISVGENFEVPMDKRHGSNWSSTLETKQATEIRNDAATGNVKVHLFGPKPSVASQPITTEVVGLNYHNRMTVVRKLSVGETITLRREPLNPYDCNAVMVLRQTGEQFGYINRCLAAELAPQFNAYGQDVLATVKSNSWIGRASVSIEFTA